MSHKSIKKKIDTWNRNRSRMIRPDDAHNFDRFIIGILSLSSALTRDIQIYLKKCGWKANVFFLRRVDSLSLSLR